MTYSCTSHCGTCGCHFMTDDAFDLHRSGSFKKGRRCRPPEQVKTKDGRHKLTSVKGTCFVVKPEKNVTIWKEV